MINTKKYAKTVFIVLFFILLMTGGNVSYSVNKHKVKASYKVGDMPFQGASCQSFEYAPMKTRRGTIYNTIAGKRYSAEDLTWLPPELKQAVFLRLPPLLKFNYSLWSSEFCQSFLPDHLNSQVVNIGFPELCDITLNRKVIDAYHQKRSTLFADLLKEEFLATIDTVMGMKNGIVLPSLVYRYNYHFVVERDSLPSWRTCQKDVWVAIKNLFANNYDRFFILLLLDEFQQKNNIQESNKSEKLQVLVDFHRKVRCQATVDNICSSMELKNYKKALSFIRKDPVASLKFLVSKPEMASELFKKLRDTRTLEGRDDDSEEIRPLDMLCTVVDKEDLHWLLLKYLVSYKNSKIKEKEKFRLEAQRSELKLLRDSDEEMRKAMDNFMFIAPITETKLYPFRNLEGNQNVGIMPCNIL